LRATVVVIACLLLIAPALRAQGPQDAPFEPRELAQALSARAPAWVAEVLQVYAQGDVVVVNLRGLSRRVELGGARGAEAARVVALVVADLSEQGGAMPRDPRAAVPSPPPVERESELIPALRSPASSVRPRGPDKLRLSLDLATQRGAAASDFWGFDVGIGLNGVLRERWLLGARVGYWVSIAQYMPQIEQTTRLHALTLRALGGLRLGAVELALGPVLAPLWIQHQDMHFLLPGGFLQVGLSLPASASLSMFARAQLDVFAARARFFEWNTLVFTTPRLMFGLALGFAWGWT
jgi:hypothetical protein